MHNSNDFDSLLPHMKRAGFVATSLAATISASFGWTIGSGYVEKGCFAVGLALASFIVGYSLVAAYHAYSRQMKAVGHAAVALFAVAVTVEFLSHVGFTASHRAGNIEAAQLQTINFTDTRSGVADLERELSRLEAKYDWSKSYDPPESYTARIEAAKLKADNEAKRGGCGRVCEARKAEHASLIAEQAIAADRIAVAEEIKATKTKLTEARKDAGSKTKGVSTAASQGLVLATLVSGDLKPSSEAQQWTNIGISALLALFFITAGLLNFVAYAFEGLGNTARKVVDNVADVVSQALPPRPLPPGDVGYSPVGMLAGAIRQARESAQRPGAVWNAG